MPSIHDNHAFREMQERYDYRTEPDDLDLWLEEVEDVEPMEEE